MDLFIEMNWKYLPNAPNPKVCFENFVFFFEDLFIIKKSEEDENDDGVKVMKIIYS